MSNLQQNLQKDEEIVYVAKVHWACLIPHIILMLVIIGFFTIVPAIIRMYTTELFITNKRLVGKLGLINTKTLDTPLNKINNTSVKNGLGGKIFGYGDLTVTSSSGAYNFRGIANPSAFRSSLMEHIELYDEARIKKQAAEMVSAMKQN